MQIEQIQNKIESALRHFVEEMGEKNGLRDACEYALLNGGKRFRPILVLMIAEALGAKRDVMDAALSVEFFHTASLIADDLPCMDNDDIRRDQPTVHKVFGESIAILASYALIAEGYGGIFRNGKECPELASICLKFATKCAGVNGATGGQFLDLYPVQSSLKAIQKVIYQKTVTLFEISFIFGWVFGGGDLSKIQEVELSAYHLGMAFQIADDLLDEIQDSQTNIIFAVGKERAIEMFKEEMNAFISSLKELELWNDNFKQVIRWLQNYASTGTSSAFLSATPASLS